MEVCFQVGISSTANIVQCGGEAGASDECGTFLQVHLPETPKFQIKGVNVLENYLSLPIQCPGARCSENFPVGRRFEVRASPEPGSKLLFGPVSIKHVEETRCDEPKQTQNIRFRQPHPKQKVNCRETRVYWSEQIVGPGYEGCALLYVSDEVRYDHNSFFCDEESIDPYFVRGGEASAFIWTGSDYDHMLAQAKIFEEQIAGYTTVTLSSYFGLPQCVCKKSWVRRDKPGCFETHQQGCPLLPCDDPDGERWCEVEEAPCATEEFGDGGGWTKCGDDAVARGDKAPEPKNDRRILCARDYEIWWVQRTGHGRTIQKKKGFSVASPPCRFDKVNNRYFPYAHISDVEVIKEREHVVRDLFDNNDRQFHARTRFINTFGARASQASAFFEPGHPFSAVPVCMRSCPQLIPLFDNHPDADGQVVESTFYDFCQILIDSGNTGDKTSLLKSVREMRTHRHDANIASRC
jgi:hypothetical protein